MKPAACTTRLARVVMLAVIALSGPGIAGCAADGHTRLVPARPAETIVSDVESAEGGDTVSVQPGQRVAVRLRSSSSTGYAWRLASGAAEGDVASLAERREESDGGKTWTVFTLQANRTGTTMVEFVLERPWEKKQQPAKRFALQFSVAE